MNFANLFSPSTPLDLDIGRTADKALESTGRGGAAAGITGITIDKSVEFSYEELAQATNDFNLACKIGQGGFGAVYYAELRGEVCHHKYFYSLSALVLKASSITSY